MIVFALLNDLERFYDFSWEEFLTQYKMALFPRQIFSKVGKKWVSVIHTIFIYLREELFANTPCTMNWKFDANLLVCWSIQNRDKFLQECQMTEAGLNQNETEILHQNKHSPEPHGLCLLCGIVDFQQEWALVLYFTYVGVLILC